MNVLFEDAGALRAGTILSEPTGALLVELPGGKREKVRADRVLLHFPRPLPAELLPDAQKLATEIDLEFLWECAGESEFEFADLARDYFGHAPSPVESAAMLVVLFGAPTHFSRRGVGRFQAVTAEVRQAAEKAAARKQKQLEKQTSLADQLVAGELPKEIAARMPFVLYKPDPSWIEHKAIVQACERARLSPARLLERCGAIAGSHGFHLGRFLLDYFPKGRSVETAAAVDPLPELPLADVAAFSIDDTSTTEIDDAFSVTRQRDGSVRVGIHIAAPALGFQPGSPLDEIARQRLSTVYMPGDKITMLPPQAIYPFTLTEGKNCPAVSLYLTVAGDGSYRILGEESRLERVPIVRNLRYPAIDSQFSLANIESGQLDFEFGQELLFLYELANRLQALRGKPEQEQLDYIFSFTDGRIDITRRVRGGPPDKVVAELMIYVNSAWGKLLGDRDIRALYRVQDSGKVRLSLYPAPHGGLGVTQYLWSSSPLRRYCDLVNQWILIARLYEEPSPYADSETDLLKVMRDFETTYAGYDEFQRNMERYTGIRYLQQEGITQTTATVIRDNLLRLDLVPIWQRVQSLPELPVGTQVVVDVAHLDEFELTLHIEFRRKLDVATP
ncbi:MAG: RNB domain-containing ribonuclease [Myxococcales bacterium]|nr:RNB domain-containing ribonuclease [Myxococcales bacterium]